MDVTALELLEGMFITMAKQTQPSYTDLIYEALRAAKEPLSFDQLLAAVESRRRITSKNPKQTIRNAPSQSAQIVSLDSTMYGYLPYLLSDTYFRLTFASEHPESQPLVYPAELGNALCPGLRDARKRQNDRPVNLLLPGGNTVALSWELMEPYAIGSPLPDALRSLLSDHNASPGDALLIHLVDAVTGEAEAIFLAHGQRDEAMIARRNQALTATIESLFRSRRMPTLFIPEITKRLFAQGFYRDPMAPDSVEAVLKSNDRFIESWYSWSFTDMMSPDGVRALKEHNDMLEVMMENTRAASLGEFTPTLLPEPSPMAMRGNAERALADVTALLEEQNFETIEEANAFLQALVDSGQPPPHHSETPLDHAQDLIYQAWEAATPHKAIRLAKKALKESPDCADAYVLLGDLTARTPEKAAELYAQGMAAGERALGPEAKAELNERVPILRVPGDRPAAHDRRDGIPAKADDSRHHFAHALAERLQLGRLQG